MFNNHFRMALRSMRRNAVSAFLNIFGLALGFTAAFLILLWVRDELSYDNHLEGIEDVYRVMRTSSFGPGQVFTWPAITAKLDDVLDEEYPEIAFAALVSWEQNMSFLRGSVTFREDGLHAGPDFFRILKAEFVAGNAETALQDPNGLVLTESMARKYFEEIYASAASDASAALRVVGQTLILDNRTELVVTGIVRDVPPQAVHQYDYVVAMDEFIRRNAWVDDWGNNGLRMLVRLTPGSSGADVSAALHGLMKEKNDDDNNVLFLQPYKDVHLRSTYENGILVGGRIDYIRIFGLVGLLILAIAAINFMNLATARSAQRAMEVGIRKTFGSSRRELAARFLGESVLTACMALAVAVVAAWLLVPWFNSVTGKAIAFRLSDVSMISAFLGMAVATGVLAGLYPAAYLSSFGAIGVIRRGEAGTSRGSGLRKGLVVLQFFMSIVLIVSALTVSDQVDFIRSKNLGMERQDVFLARLEGGMAERFDEYRARMLVSTAVESVTASSHSPLSVGSSTSGGVSWEGKDPEDNTLYYILQAAHDFIPTMKMELMAGRDFSRELGSDSANVIINEAAARAMGFENPVGERVRVWGRDGEIIGIVKDFHLASIHDPIEPLVLRLAPENTSMTFIRPAAGQTEQALGVFETVFREFNPTYPFDYQFLDDQFERTYNAEIVMEKLAFWFTALAILVACLGLFGLASYTAERRTREIGIRKVLGATVGQIVVLLSSDFMRLILLAFLAAVPVSWFVMSRWLDQFEFHATLGFGVYAATAVLVLGIAWATVGWQAIRAALTNPATAIRSE